ncbi:uncharacterized protein K441DRAFT_677341 [Cenococcum geophilum 1.58]|uniref:uncharacterized protein n=1 Tax=Cenococcum geophilum 1.58 TaxID=794803 RepID=UPI00358EBE0A|nr:hypothetical protein K441DRAFT_677341 [Cenococcum geophilum 1.58]
MIGLASKKPTNAAKQATTTATSATTPKPMSPVAVPAIDLASKTPAIKSNTSNLEDNLDELLRTDKLTEEEMKAWSLRFYGTYPPPPSPPLTAEQISEALDSC